MGDIRKGQTNMNTSANVDAAKQAQLDGFKDALKAKLAEKASLKAAAQEAAVPTVKVATKKAAPAKVAVPKAPKAAKAEAAPAPTKYVAEAPDHYFVARDVRGRILPLVHDGKLLYAVPQDLKETLVAKVQYGPVYKTAGLFVTVHRNSTTEGERRLTVLRNLWASKNPAVWTQPKNGDWSQVVVVGKEEKTAKVFAGITTR